MCAGGCAAGPIFLQQGPLQGRRAQTAANSAVWPRFGRAHCLEAVQCDKGCRENASDMKKQLTQFLSSNYSCGSCSKEILFHFLAS